VTVWRSLMLGMKVRGVIGDGIGKDGVVLIVID